MKSTKNEKHIKNLKKEKLLTKICKERGWNINELTTGQMLFLVSLPEVKSHQ